MSNSTKDGDDDDEEQPADKVTGEKKRPLGEKLPNGTEVEDSDGTFNLTGAIELHRLVLKDDYYQLRMQKDEITRTIIDSTCAIEDAYGNHYKEVSQLPLPLPLLRRSRHCSSHVGETHLETILFQLCCS